MTWSVRLRRYLRRNALAYWLILPSLLFLLAIEFVPLLKGLSEAVQYHNRVQPWLTHFNGIDNFVQAFNDHAVWIALRTSFVVVVGVVLLSYVLGLIAAVLLNQKLLLRGVYRALILVPWVVPPVVAFISWQWMLSDQDGIINRTLFALGIIHSPIEWLADPNLALLCLVVVGVWSRFSFMMITILAALANVPDDIYEAGAVDGASSLQLFRFITFPLILPVSVIATLLQAIWTFNDFGLPFVLTGGGPANATTTLILLAYKEAFQHFNIGYGTALAVISMILMLALGTVYLRLQAQQGIYQ
jgi:ABC-type sugar transport system permease subunit